MIAGDAITQESSGMSKGEWQELAQTLKLKEQQPA